MTAYAPNKGTSKYGAKTERTKGKIDKCTVIARDFNTLLSVTSGSRKSRQKISKHAEDLSNTINKLDLNY